MSKVMIGDPSQSDMILGISLGIVGLLVDILIFPVYAYIEGDRG